MIVKISPKFQVVVPESIRNTLGLKPGEKVQVFAYENRIEYIPLRRMRDMRGFLKGMDTDVERDADRL